MLADLGTHYLDAINYCMGGISWKNASGKCISSPLLKDMSHVKKGYGHCDCTHSDVEDYVFGSAESSDGVTMSFEGCWAQNVAEEEKYIDFLGDKGAVRFEYYSGYRLWKNGRLAESADNAYDGKMYINQMESFINDISLRRLNGTNSIGNVISTVKLIDDVYSYDAQK